MNARSPLQKITSLRNWSLADIKGQKAKLNGLLQAKLINKGQFNNSIAWLDTLAICIDTAWQRERKKLSVKPQNHKPHTTA